MSIAQKKKEQIINYMLTKIDMRQDVVKKTIDCFEISHTTVYRYLKELENVGLIVKQKKGKYILVNEQKDFSFVNIDLEEDTIFYKYIEPMLSEFSQNTKKIWTYAFTEIFNNAIEHSESDKIDCSIYKNAISTTILICDYGIGIFKKIQEYYKYNELEDAISELFKGKLTTDSENHTGEGIFFTSRLMDEFLVFSDNKFFTHNNHIETIEDVDAESILAKLLSKKGTVVYMELANKTHKELREVFDMYADIDGGLTRTSIPMKNVFGNTFPVSRSQARRLSNRLEQFKEVELDFSGVDEIGQGFADELFGKFAARHPETNLIIKNENKEIRNMISHVNSKL